MPLRTVQRLVDGAWIAIEWEDIRKGDRVRIAESDGVPVTEAIAESDYDPTLGTGGFSGSLGFTQGMRRINVLILGEWEEDNWDMIDVGTIFRVYEENGSQLPGEWIALTRPDPKDETGFVKVKPYEVPDGRA